MLPAPDDASPPAALDLDGPEGAELRLGARVTVAQAAALKKLLQAALPAASLTVSAAAVERIDGAGLQLLLALIRTRAAAGRPTRWREVGGPLSSAADALGLAVPLALTSPHPNELHP